MKVGELEDLQNSTMYSLPGSAARLHGDFLDATDNALADL